MINFTVMTIRRMSDYQSIEIVEVYFFLWEHGILFVVTFDLIVCWHRNKQYITTNKISCGDDFCWESTDRFNCSTTIQLHAIELSFRGPHRMGPFNYKYPPPSVMTRTAVSHTMQTCISSGLSDITSLNVDVFDMSTLDICSC